MTGRPIRFATQLGALRSAPEEDWIARVRRLEAVGYGTLAMPDHVVGQAWAPHPALAAVAATTGLRVGTLVIDNDFRNPLITAREAATLDTLSDGRYELGLGAGWLDRDYLSLGIPFDRGRVRVERLAEAVTLIKRLFTEDEVTFEGRYYRTEKAVCLPKPVQRPHPPILIAGGGPLMLELAAREADIFALVHYGAGQRAPKAADVSVEGALTQLRALRDAAGPRYERIELSMFVDCVVTDDRAATIAELAEKAKADPAVLAASIYRGIGTLDQIGSHLERLHRDLGMSYFCLRGPDIERLGPVIRGLATAP